MRTRTKRSWRTKETGVYKKTEEKQKPRWRGKLIESMKKGEVRHKRTRGREREREEEKRRATRETRDNKERMKERDKKRK